MVLTSTGQKQALKQIPLQKFEYEIQYTAMGRRITLYDRITNEKGENILRFLTQAYIENKVPTNEDLENEIRQAVDKVYENMGATKLPIIRIQAEHLHKTWPLPFLDYLR